MIRQPVIGVLLAIAAAVLAAYANALDATFQLDDQTSIVANEAIRQLEPGAWWRFWPTRLLAYGSFALSHALHGLDARGFRLDGLALHVATSWIVYAFVRILLQLRSYQGPGGWVALTSALVFALHPLQTQAVTYVVQRTAALCAFFYLAALTVWLVGLQRRRANASCRWCLPAVLGLGLAANLTKELAVTLPLALLAVDWIATSDLQGRWRRWWPTAVLFLVVPVLAATQGRFGVGEAELTAETARVSRVDYWVTQWEVVTRYLGLFCWPSGQNVDHDIRWRGFASGWPWLLPHLLLLAAAVAAGRRGRWIPVFALVWTYLTLAPESSLFPIRDAMFEHRMYLPLVGPALLIGWGVGQLHARSRIAGLVTLAMLVTALGAATHHRNRVWATPLTLWSDAVAKSPEKSRPHMALGQALGQEGRSARASAHLRRAVVLDPRSYKAWTNLGNVQLGSGDLAGAETSYRRALALKPDHLSARYNLAVLQERAGRFGEAEVTYREVLRAAATHGGALNALASLRLRQGDVDEAERLARRAAAAGKGSPALLEAIARERGRATVPR